MHTKSALYRFFILVFLLAPLIAIGSEDPMAPIDKIFNYRASYTGAKNQEIVEVRINARNINEPVTWTLTIKAGNKEIYRHIQDDKRIDELFREDGFMEGCHGYLECKRKYYFSYLPKFFTRKGVLANKIILDEYFIDNLRSTASEFLISHSLQASQISEVTDNMIAQLRSGKVVTLVVLESPVHAGPPMMWVSKVNLFVPYYHE